MFRFVSLRRALQPLRASAASGIPATHIQILTLKSDTFKPSLWPATPPQRRERYGYVGLSFHFVTLQTPHTPSSKSERAPSAPLQSHTRSLINNKNQKACKCSPQAVPCKGLSALRVRLIKISTLWSLPSLRVVFLSAQP